MADDRRTSSPGTAAALSALLPGIGQLANGERAKGLAVLASSLGVIVGAWLSVQGPAFLRSWISFAMLVAIYPLIWFPAVVDARRSAQGRPSPLLEGQRIWYVLVMLAVVGPMAMPLLWQSERFPRWAKVLLSLAVIAIALGAIAFAVWVGPIIERELGAFSNQL